MKSIHERSEICFSFLFIFNFYQNIVNYLALFKCFCNVGTQNWKSFRVEKKYHVLDMAVPYYVGNENLQNVFASYVWVW